LVIVSRFTQRSQRQHRSKKIGQEFAGVWVRLASITLDWFLVQVFQLFPIFVLTLFYSMMTSETYLKFILFSFFPFIILASFFYVAWFDAEGRCTAGKKLFGLAVVDTSFKSITFSKSLLRTLAYIIDIPGIWFILVNKKKQTVHDMLAKTYVIRAKAPHKLEKLFIFGLFALLVGYFLYGSDYVKNHYIRNYIQAFRIPTGGMKSTIPVGDFILVDKYWPRNNFSQQGDIVVFKYPEDPSLDYIKRCVAVGGQTIEVRNGDVYIDGKPEGKEVALGRKYIPEDGRNVKYTKIKTPNGKNYVVRHYVDRSSQNDNYGPVTVPEGHYFVMGDNRDNSADSRTWGFLPEDNVVGKAGIIYWSWDRVNKKVRWLRIGRTLE